MLYTLFSVTDKYFRYPVVVGIDIQHASDLEFPAVTVCNVSPMRYSLYENWALAKTTAGQGSKRRRKRATGK